MPVVCVDADVPGSKRLAFIGTDWYDLGVRQGEAMVRALRGRAGTVAMLGSDRAVHRPGGVRRVPLGGRSRPG